jgi:hypothetical protein
MTVTSIFRSFLLCAALLAGTWAADAEGAVTGSFQRTISVDEGVSLDVSAGSGSITIHAGDSGKIEIIGHIKVRRGGFLGLFKKSSDKQEEFVQLFESEPPVILEDGQLRVGHVEGNKYGRNTSISYEISVPVSTEVKSHTGSGSQEISGVSGPVEVHTGSGSTTLTDIGGSVSASSGSGSITADGIAGAFEAHAGSGSIRLTQEAPGDVVVTTGSGSSELHGVVGALRAKAGSGRIVVDGQQAGDWYLDTGSGSVKVSLPGDAAFELDAETGSGGIDISHPLTVQGKISKKHVRGQVRGGGEMLTIETGSGSIRIR